MPRKKSEEGKPMNAAGVELKPVRLELSPEAHRQLRIKAAIEGMSMASYARQIVEEFLAVDPAPAPRKGRPK